MPDPKPKLPVPCAQCGEMFAPSRADHRYCGPVCRSRAQDEKRRGVRPRPPAPVISRLCLCGNEPENSLGVPRCAACRAGPRLCPCGNEPANGKGVPVCTDCQLEKTRAYHREYKNREWAQDRIRRGLPVPGDQVTTLCGWCEKEFTFVFRGQPRAKCDACKKRSGTALRAAWAKSHPDDRVAHKRRYNSSAAGKAAAAAYNRSQRFRKYGLSEERFDEMLCQQGGRCAICRTAEPGGRHGTWSVDHDRQCCPRSGSCGRCVRGLLCDLCNTGIGMLRDDPEILRAATEYVERFSRNDLPGAGAGHPGPGPGARDHPARRDTR